MLVARKYQITYLANVISVVMSDGKLTNNEKEIFSEIQKKIGARKSELKKAMKLVESSEYIAVPTGNFSIKVLNFHDILYAVMIDKRIDDYKKRKIIEFAKAIGLIKVQIDEIMKDVRLLTCNKKKKCSKCGVLLPNNVKFCPECGVRIDELENKEEIQVSFDIPLSGITIEFSESTSANFTYALKTAKISEVFQECIKGNKKWFLASWPIAKINESIKLANNLDGLKNKKVFINGEEKRWNDIFSFIRCYLERKSAYNPTEYCFGLDIKNLNIWGCRNSQLNWNSWENWFSYGRFESSGILKKKMYFIFDKKRIEHELKTNLFRYKFCPNINFELILTILKIFPEKVEVSEKSDWKYKKAYEDLPGHVKVEKTVKNIFGNNYTEEFYVCGVVPKGSYVGLEILKKAIKLCNAKEIQVEKLLEYKEK